MTKDKHIEPCIFCGNLKPRCKTTSDGKSRVICHRCFARGPYYSGSTWGNPKDKFKNLAIDAWNQARERGEND